MLLEMLVIVQLFVLWNQKVYHVCQKFPIFKQPEVSLPCSQEPAPRSLPDLDNSIPHLFFCLLRLMLVISSYICLGLSAGVFL